MSRNTLAALRNSERNALPDDWSAMTLGQRLMALRRRNGLSQLELARASGVSQQMVCELERGGQANPTIRTLRHLATALKVYCGCLLD